MVNAVSRQGFLMMKALLNNAVFTTGRQCIAQTFYKQQKILPILYAFLAAGICLIAYDELGTWKATGWAVTYQDFGFVKRGLPGSLLPQFLYGYNGFSFISLCLQLTLMLAVYYLVWKIHCQSQHEFSFEKLTFHHLQLMAFFLCLFSLLAPFTLQQFSKDFGRFDQICLLMAMLSIVLFLFSKVKLNILIIALMFVMMPLVHEASILIIAPTYIAAMMLVAWQAYEQQVSIWQPTVKKITILISVLGLLVSFLMVVILGKYGDEATLFSIYQNLELDFDIEKGSVLVLNRTLEDNINLTVAELPRRLLQIIGLLVFMIPIWKVLGCLHKQVKSVLKHAWLIPLSTASILPMFILGIDFFRWIALAIFNLWFVQMLLIFRFNKIHFLLEALYQERRWLYLSVFASIWMGPIGITSYFPDPWLLLIGH
jgi:hypothetical protein